MPFKSEAQKKKFGQLVSEGKMSKETYEKWDSETGKKKLPARAGKTKSSVRKVRAVK